MAIFVATDCTVSINGVDLSDHCRKATLTDTREKIDITAFGASSKVYAKGLGDASAQFEFYQDFAASEVYATLQPLIDSDTPVTVIAKPTSAALSATNPGWTISALLFDFNMLDASVGETAMVNVELANASQAGVTYDITP